MARSAVQSIPDRCRLHGRDRDSRRSGPRNGRQPIRPDLAPKNLWDAGYSWACSERGRLGPFLASRFKGSLGRYYNRSQTRAGGIADLIPGADRFRYYTVTGSYPVIKKEDYSLLVGGLVRRPLTLSYADLLALPRTELVRDFQCVTGWRCPPSAGPEYSLVTLSTCPRLRPTRRQ